MNDETCWHGNEQPWPFPVGEGDDGEPAHAQTGGQ